MATIAHHATRAAIGTGRAATSAIRGVHSELPLPQPPAYGGYWSFVSASLILLFVLYLAANNRLGVWIAFFSWTKPGVIATATDAGSSTGQTATSGNPNIGTVVGAGAGQPGINLNNPFAGIPGIGGGFQTLLPGNSNGSGTQSTPGQANPIPWGSVGTWLQGLNPFGTKTGQ